MSRVQTLQTLFKRYRRAGDIVFAVIFFGLSLFLLAQITQQTTFNAGGKLITQPRFWPAVSLIGMTLFAALHLFSSALSPRIAGRWQEVTLWLKSLEYAVWFIGYALIVPYTGYLLSTLIFTPLLAYRVGYRQRGILLIATTTALTIVVIFQSFLQVKLPSGQLYSFLPDGIRQFMFIYF